MSEKEVFHNLALFDGVLPQTQVDGWLEVADGRIRRIGLGPPPLHEGKEGIDLGGQTVIPGLIDAHVHLMVHAGRKVWQHKGNSLVPILSVVFQTSA